MAIIKTIANSLHATFNCIISLRYFLLCLWLLSHVHNINNWVCLVIPKSTTTNSRTFCRTFKNFQGHFQQILRSLKMLLLTQNLWWLVTAGRNPAFGSEDADPPRNLTTNTKCNSPPITGQCTSHYIALQWYSRLPLVHGCLL